MYHFRDQIRSGNPTAFFIINGDVCGDFPLLEMCDFYGEKEALIVVAGTEATRNQSVNYGNMSGKTRHGMCTVIKRTD
jgi:mannose-1-phosphate guanylyltransferase